MPQVGTSDYKNLPTTRLVSVDGRLKPRQNVIKSNEETPVELDQGQMELKAKEYSTAEIPSWNDTIRLNSKRS